MYSIVLTTISAVWTALCGLLIVLVNILCILSKQSDLFWLVRIYFIILNQYNASHTHSIRPGEPRSTISLSFSSFRLYEAIPWD
jgi:hypothetical protein